VNGFSVGATLSALLGLGASRSSTVEPALCLALCGGSTALLLGALGLSLTLKAADSAAKCEEGLF